ncbi:MAG: response regulator [bacterium]
MSNLNQEQIEQLFNLVGQVAPDNPTSEEISEILIKIEKKISPGYIQTQNSTKFLNNANVLLVDDLELSIYQLSKLLTNCNYNTIIARSVEEALDYYKKQSFQYVIVDLFLPNPEDGLHLIDSINNSEKTKNDNTKIIVISGSDDKALINECFLKGANEFVSKLPDWHKKILHHIGHLEVKKYGSIPEVLTKIEDTEMKIASITLSNLYKNEVIETLKKEIQILINTGYINLILDLEKVKNLDSNGLNAIVDAYKSCSEKKGILKLCGVNNTIMDVLSYVFLNNLISVFKDKDSALFDYKKENSLNSSNKLK